MSEGSRVREGGFLITKIHHLGKRIFSKKLKKYGIRVSQGQGRILFSLWQGDNISFNELAQRTALGKSTLTEMIDKLEASSHVVRIPSDTDRRMTLIKTTDKTRKFYQRYEEVSEEMKELFYKGFSETEIDTFEMFLKRILKNLTANSSEES